MRTAEKEIIQGQYFTLHYEKTKQNTFLCAKNLKKGTGFFQS